MSGTELILNGDAFKHLPTVLTIDMFLFWIFAKWGWKWTFLQGWLVPFPDLNGIWKGKIKSLWKNSDKTEEIITTLTIKQTFLNIHCGVKTMESESESYSASFIVNPETGKKQLVYSYYNKPKPSVRDGSIPHDGTVLLNIIVDNAKVKLEGEYWTSRKSIGEIFLEKADSNTKGEVLNAAE